MTVGRGPQKTLVASHPAVCQPLGHPDPRGAGHVREPRGTGSREVGAPTLRHRRMAIGCAAGEGRAQGRDQGTCFAHLAAPDDGQAGPLRLLDDRALVLPGLEGTHRPGRQSPPQGARQCRTAARDQRRGASGRAGAIRSPPGLERAAASRQPRCPRRDATRTQAGSVLPDAAPVPEGQWPRQTPPGDVTPDGGRRARRGPARRA